MAIQIPNLRIKSMLEGLISVVVEDYKDKVIANIESESWLYRTFYGVQYSSEFDFYKQVKELIINRDENSPRKLDIRIGFPQQKPTLPTVSILSPSEEQDGINTIGMGMDTAEYHSNSDGSTSDIFNRGFKPTYEISIYSGNEFETELVYRLIQALFISNYDTINEYFNGTFNFSGKDTVIQTQDMITTYMKTWIITIQYTQKVPAMNSVEYLNKVLFILENIKA